MAEASTQMAESGFEVAIVVCGAVFVKHPALLVDGLSGRRGNLEDAAENRNGGKS